MKKTICTLSAGALLATALPALADHDHDRRTQRHRVHERVVVERPAVVERRVVERRTVVVHQEPRYYGRARYAEPVYAPAPAPYYYAQEPYYAEPAYAPAPVYASRDNTLGIIGGAAIGAAIGSQVGHGHDRAATTAVGAILGGILGSNF